MYNPREVFEKVKCENCEAFRVLDDNKITNCEEGSQDPCFQQYILEQNKLMLEELIRLYEWQITTNLDISLVWVSAVRKLIEQIAQKKIEEVL